MCAICGWQNLSEDLTDRQEKFKNMVELMSCRGKDNTGSHYARDAANVFL